MSGSIAPVGASGRRRSRRGSSRREGSTSAVLVSADRPCSAAGTFTTNRVWPRPCSGIGRSPRRRSGPSSSTPATPTRRPAPGARERRATAEPRGQACSAAGRAGPGRVDGRHRPSAARWIGSKPGFERPSTSSRRPIRASDGLAGDHDDRHPAQGRLAPRGDRAGRRSRSSAWPRGRR